MVDEAQDCSTADLYILNKLYDVGDRDANAADFIGYTTKLDISPGDCLVLAHAQTTLPKTYAGAATPPSSKAAALAWAVGIITEYPTARARSATGPVTSSPVLCCAGGTPTPTTAPRRRAFPHTTSPRQCSNGWIAAGLATGMTPTGVSTRSGIRSDLVGDTGIEPVTSSV